MTKEAINEEAVSAWLKKSLEEKNRDFTLPFSYSLIQQGQSNLTFTVSDKDNRKWVLRRPPLHQVLSTAHDMVREHTIISALHSIDFLVPEPIALCTDETINTFPFYIMEFVDGLIISNVEIAQSVPTNIKNNSGIALAETLAHLHSYDPDEIGLSDFAKKADYIQRQLHRWLKQFKQSTAPQSSDIEKIHDILLKNVPPQKYTGIVHADYRLDNCVLDPTTGKVKAVLDWELCTLGDTMADIGISACYWAESSDDVEPLFDSPTSHPDFINRKELLEAYAKTSNKDLGDIEYYIAFASWRLVCILQGVYSRYLAGAMKGKTPPGGVDGLKIRIDDLTKKTWDYIKNI